MASEQTRTAEQTPNRSASINLSSKRPVDDGYKTDKASSSFSAASSQAQENIAKAATINREMTELTTERVKSLLSAYTNYARGLFEMQRAYLELIHRSLELTQRASRELIRCTCPSDVAEVQRDVLQEGMNQVFEGTSKILQASSKAAEDAIRPIEEQLRHAA